jgi:hypothetical protein
MKYRA